MATAAPPPNRHLPPELVAAWSLLKRPIWLFDPIACRGVYANPAALHLWGAVNLDELLARDFSLLSPAVRARTDRLAAATAQGATVSERWTFYPMNVPTTVEAAISSLAMPDGQDVLLFEASPVGAEDEALRALEAFRHTPSVVSVFDSFGGQLYSNPAAFAVYGAADLGLAPRFVDPDEGFHLMDAVLDGAATTVVAEVRTADGVRRHRLTAAVMTDPVTGQPAILISEREVSTELLKLEAENAELKAALRDLIAAHRRRAA